MRKMSEWFIKYGNQLLTATLIHLLYVLICVSIAFVVALFCGIFLSRRPKLASVIVPILSIFQTIPGIVFIGILFLYLGMTPTTVILALTIYATFPILKNTITGLREVPFEYVDAAKGCGMGATQSLLLVELPLAMPSILGGLKMSTVYTVSWAILASMIGQGGLGDFVYIGISTNNAILIVTGAIPAAIMAIIFSLLLTQLQNRVKRRVSGKAVKS